VTDENRERLLRDWQALRGACRKQHGGGAGGAAVCVCGAGGGGSPACSMLGTLKSFFRYVDESKLDPAFRELVLVLRNVV
jgi:hypothetical protein